jgi:hypothetical protein
MSNPWQQIFESHREQFEENYIAEKYGQHRGDESQETQALYDLRNKLKNMGKDAVLAYLKRSKMSPERKARLAKELGISIAEERIQEKVRNPYAIGMAAAMKSTGDKPPLEKSTIKKAHKIAKKVEEDVEYIEEESKILVRVTKEDGSVFQKKIPASQLADYRSRYKAVVVVGGSEQSRTGVGTKSEEYVNEADKKKTHRWWDDDGDGIGYEKGEVSGKFKKKKKVKEQFSDWRSEFPELSEATKAQKSVEGNGPNATYDTQEENKKKRKKKSSKSECDCSHEVKESAETLAQELGGELVDIKEYAAAIAPIAKSAIKAFVRPKPLVIPKIVPFVRPAPSPIKPPSPAPIVPAKPGTPTKPAKPGTPTKPTKPGTPTKPTKPGTPTKPAKPGTPTKPAKPGTPTKPAKPGTSKIGDDKLVRIDTKTGAITDPNVNAEKMQPTPNIGKGSRGPGSNPPRSGPTGRRLPIGLPKLSIKLPDPVPQAQQFKV